MEELNFRVDFNGGRIYSPSGRVIGTQVETVSPEECVRLGLKPPRGVDLGIIKLQSSDWLVRGYVNSQVIPDHYLKTLAVMVESGRNTTESIPTTT